VCKTELYPELWAQISMLSGLVRMLDSAGCDKDEYRFMADVLRPISSRLCDIYEALDDNTKEGKRG
jgi:hypothetical protein